MINILKIIIWNITDIFSGRRIHFVRVCLRAIIDAMNPIKNYPSPKREIIETILAFPILAFDQDFRKGIFKKWLKNLDGTKTKEVFSVYLACLFQVCSIKDLWNELKIPENEIWDSLVSLFPETEKYREKIIGLDEYQLVKRISRIRNDFWRIINPDREEWEKSLLGQILFIENYHVIFFVDGSDKLLQQLLKLKERLPAFNSK
jgi:hypothetical protein